MKLPKGVTEIELVALIDRVVNKLAYRFQFGYHDIEDIKQHGRLVALKALSKYDNKRSLYNFLWTVVRNGLFNYKRDNFERPDKPCVDCIDGVGEDGCLRYSDKCKCRWHRCWIQRNNAKKNLMQPIELSLVVDGDHSEESMKVYCNVEEKLSTNEIIDIIDAAIPSFLRKDWLLLKQDMPIPKYRRQKLHKYIQEILERANIDEKICTT